MLQDLDLLRAFGSRLSVGLSIPTDDDTVRQIVEPHAPAIPSRWAAIEKLAAAGIAVTVGVAPLLAVHDAQAFARRALASGATNVWVGGLRLLKQDPFYKLLADHGWLKVLDPDYKEGIRQAFAEAFPARKSPKIPKAKAAPAVKVMAEPRQPGLFDRVG